MYYRATSEHDLLAFRRDHPDCAILAGCTDLLPQSRRRGALPDYLADPGPVRQAWSGIRAEGRRLFIGAFTTFSAMLESPLLGRRYPLLREAIRWLGSRQIRNQATPGGNLANASPAGDSMPPLMVYEACVHARSLAGERIIPVDAFFQGYKQTALLPGELISGISLPPPPAGREYYRKAGPRRVLVISRTALAARRLRLVPAAGAGSPGTTNPWRIAAGGVAPVPVRLHAVEEYLAAHAPDASGLSTALGRDISPVSDIRGSAGYKFEATLHYLEEMLEKLVPR